MTITGISGKSISETYLRALYSRLPGVLREGLYGPKFSKQLQVWRETLHPRGITDIRTLDGFDNLIVQVNLGDRLGCDIYYGFFQERLDYNLFMNTLRPGDIVVDIGSNFGMYALGAAKRLVSAGRVFAFEPDIRSLALLNKNIRRNNFENIIICLDVCIGSYDGEVDFFAATDPSFSGMYDTKRSETINRLTLPVRRLDSIMREQGVCKVNKIKIDVEGAEYEVLEGAAEVLANSDAMIMLEISSKNLDEDRIRKLGSFLERLGAQGYVSCLINLDVSSPVLIIDENIGEILGKQTVKVTKNYFLVKRSGKELEIIQDAFRMLKEDQLLLQENSLSDGPSFISGNTDNADYLRAMLWAIEVEKKVAADSCRQEIAQNHSLGSMLAETNRELAEQKEQKAAFKAKLAETSRELAEQRKQKVSEMVRDK